MRNLSSLLKDSFILCRRNFTFLVSVIFLSYIPGLILIGLERWFRSYLLSAFHSSFANAALCASLHLVSWFLTILGSIALIVAIQNLKQGQYPSITAVYRQAIKLFWPVLVVFIIGWLIILGGLLLLIAPGILFSIWYLFSLYAAVIHRKRKAAALALSKAVVRTSMGKVIVYMLLVGIISGGPSVLFYSLIEKGIFPSFLSYLSAVIIHSGIAGILVVWVTAFSFMFYLDLIKANPRISECFELKENRI